MSYHVNLTRAFSLLTYMHTYIHKLTWSLSPPNLLCIWEFPPIFCVHENFRHDSVLIQIFLHHGSRQRESASTTDSVSGKHTCVWMYVCMYVCVYRESASTTDSVSGKHTCVWMYAWKCVCIYIYTHIHTYIHVYVWYSCRNKKHMYAYIRVCVYACMHILIHENNVLQKVLDSNPLLEAFGNAIYIYTYTHTLIHVDV